jgi:hypothetical protein
LAVYGDRSEYAANQGDVFGSVPFAGFTMDGMITSHDCVCDKYLTPRTPLTPEAADRFAISVAPVHPVDQLTGDRRSAVRDNNMPRYFHLPEENGRPELVADLYLEQPVRFATVLEREPALSSLSPEWLARLWQQFLRLRLGEDYMTFLRQLVEEAANDAA